jgi:predicted kinase
MNKINNKLTAYILKGLPASGKSTWAKEQSAKTGAVIVNNDTIRKEIYEELGHQNWSGEIEKQVKIYREDQIEMAFDGRHDVIIDNTHCNPKAYEAIKKFCYYNLGFEIEVVDFMHVSVDECIRRDSLRTGSAQVGEAVIRKMDKMANVSKFREPLPSWTPTLQDNLIIADVDGTLAEIQNRGPYDEHLVYNDKPRNHVVVTIKSLMVGFPQVKLIVMSGRSDACYDKTYDWLIDKCGFEEGSFTLLMRAKGDRRRDSIVKRELYDQHVAGKYNVMAVFDDRHAVIKECWSALNLPVFRCGVVDKDDF